MQSRVLSSHGGLRTFAVVFETGDSVMEGLEAFAVREGLTAASFSGIGAFSDAVTGYFDWDSKNYLKNRIDEQVEVASLNGDVALAPDGAQAVHVHVVLGRRDGSAIAGHLVEAHVRPTLEVVLTETPAHLQKAVDSQSGLALIRPEAEPRQQED